MITAVFTDNSDYARATGLWQWNYGQKLRIEGLRLPTAVEIHFALTEFAGDAITRVGATKDSVTEVVIPDSMLENQAAGATYECTAWIYLVDKTSGETIKRISMQVKRRAKPEGFDAPEDAELFREAIEAVNASADRAETAREGAEAAQEAAEAAAGKIEGEIYRSRSDCRAGKAGCGCSCERQTGSISDGDRDHQECPECSRKRTGGRTFQYRSKRGTDRR